MDEEYVRLKYEIGRLVSDFDSEKRNRERTNDRMGAIEKTNTRIEDKLDWLIKDQNKEKDRAKLNWDRILLIASIIANIYLALMK